MVLLNSNHKHPKILKNVSDTSHRLAMYRAPEHFLHVSHRKEVNMTSNQIAYFKAKIDEAHYGRSDAEQARSNRVNEALTALKIENENAHYLRSDAESKRSNQARELENNRANVANETIQWAQIPALNAERYSSAARNYADVGLKEAQTSGEMYKAKVNEANSRLILDQLNTEKARRDNINANTYDVYWQENLAGYKAEENSVWRPIEEWSQAVGALSGLFRGFGAISNLGGNTNGKTTSKQQQTYYKDGVTYTNTWYTEE